MKAKKSLGQNFLNDDTICSQIVSLICPTKGDLVIEIGPGRGALTKHLIKYPSRLICIELDKDLIPHLNDLCKNKAEILNEDFLKINLEEFLKDYTYNNLFIVGNLPYYITSPIVNHILSSNVSINKMVFMVQKEVADRFAANPGTSDYGYMSVLIDAAYSCKKVIYVPRKYFTPSPNVDSAVISLERKTTDVFMNYKYNKLLMDSFHLKRKTLKNNLSNYDWNKILDVLKDNGFNENVRAEQLPQEMFKKIFNKLDL